jgi:2-polyprenyl-3-methyl-5-hydroxy-6-metoxy-1,4-benzoquinol methylase
MVRGNFREATQQMSKIGDFAQPDNSPAYFIKFLEFLDNHVTVTNFRREAAKRLNLVAGSKVLDVGCGIGGATFPLAEITGPKGLAAGVDISSAMIEVASKRCGTRQGMEFRVSEACKIPYADDFLMWHVAREFFCTCLTGWRPFTR